MWERTAAVLIAACVLSSCSRSEKAEEPAAFAAITEATVCDLVARETIERAVGLPVDGDPRAGVIEGRRECNYHTEDFDVEVELTTPLPGDDIDVDALDRMFMDSSDRYIDRPGRPHPYQRIPELGTIAGFGKLSALQNRLAVLFEVDGDRIQATVSTMNEVGPEQLTPVAKELIANLQS